MPTKKKRFARKTAKRYERVTFTLEFIDGEFDLPSFKQVPLGIQRKAMKGEVDPLYEFLEEQGGEDMVEIIDTFDADENQAFMDAWANASGVELGK